MNPLLRYPGKFLSELQLTCFWGGFHEHKYQKKWRQKFYASALALAAGFRSIEISELKCEDYDFERCMFFVEFGKGYAKTPKPRWTEIMPEFRDHWNEYMISIKGQKWVFVADPLHQTNLHFKKRRWENNEADLAALPPHPRTIRRWWKDVMRLLGIHEFSHHKARHTYLTWESERLAKNDLMDQAGHACSSTTEKYYRHAIPGRRYYKTEPKWIAACRGPKTEKLRIVEGGKG